MTAWVKRRMAQVLKRPAVPMPVEEQPEAPRSSFAEKVERWRALFRAEQAQQPTAEQIEQARERRQQAIVEAAEDEIARHIAYKSVYVEGEPLEGPAMPRGGASGTEWGGENGPWYGFIRW